MHEEFRNARRGGQNRNMQYVKDAVVKSICSFTSDLYTILKKAGESQLLQDHSQRLFKRLQILQFGKVTPM